MDENINFDALYDLYVEKWYKRNSGKYTIEQIEDMIPKLYNEWLNMYDSKIGCKPCDYHEKFSSATLLEMLDDTFEKGNAVCDALVNEIILRKDDNAVFESLKKAKDENAVMTYVNVLCDMNSKLHAGYMTDIIFSNNYSKDAKDLCGELLRNFASEVQGDISKRDAKDADTALLVCDILSNCKGSEAAFKYILNKFKSGLQIELLCHYLAKLENQDALPYLYQMIVSEDINYMQFLELRNAIEQLGGEVEIEKDFSHDEYYLKMQGKK